MKYNKFDYEVLTKKNYELALSKRTKIYYHYVERYPELTTNLTIWSTKLKDFDKRIPKKDVLLMIKCNNFINEYAQIDKRIKNANAREKRNAYKQKRLEWQMKRNLNRTSV